MPFQIVTHGDTMNATLLETYCKKYKWDDLRKRLAEAGKDGVRVGFLGEFSSGKSSLINALLEGSLLPTGDAVTTKRITEISFTDAADQPRFFGANGGEIGQEEFSGSAARPAEGHVSMKHPPKGPFTSGFSLIDTPGLASLDALDADITCGFLPFLDGAVICVDCAAGSVGQSVIGFLKRPEVAPLAGYFVFALTKADNKAPGARRAVREAVIRELQEEIYTDTPESVPARVVLTEVTDAPALADGAAFLKAWKDVFLDRVEGMRSARREKKLEEAREEMFARLERMRAALGASLPDQSRRRGELEEEKRGIERERKKRELELEVLGRNLDVDIGNLVAVYRARLDAAQAAQLMDLCESFKKDLKETVTRRLTTHFADMQAVGMPADMQKALDAMAAPDFLDHLADVGVMGALALLGPMGPLGSLAAGVLSRAVSLVGAPLLDALLYQYTTGRKKSQLDAFFARLPGAVSARIRGVIEKRYASEVFTPLEERVRAVRRNLDSLWEERERSKRGLEEQERELEAAIRELKDA